MPAWWGTADLEGAVSVVFPFCGADQEMETNADIFAVEFAGCVGVAAVLEGD